MSFYENSILFITLELIFTFFISSYVLYQGINHIFNTHSQNSLHWLKYALGLGPISISWVVIMLFLLAPGYSNTFYIAIVNCIFLVPFFFYRKTCYPFFIQLYQFIQQQKKELVKDKTTTCILLLGICCIAIVFFCALALPYSENDALEYAMLAKVMYGKHSAQMYPIIDGTQFGGFLAQYTHPLGYAGTFIWAYLIQGTADSFGLIKLISPAYATFTFLLIVSILWPSNKRLGALSGLLYIATPLIINGIIRHQIDPLRIYTFFTFFMFLPELSRAKNLGAAICAGALLGLSLFSHSIGILAIPIFLAIYPLFSREKPSTLLAKIFIILFTGLLFVLPRYYFNLLQIGYIIHDGSIVRELPSLQFYALHEIINDISTFKQKWFNSILPLFYNFLFFGFSYLLVIVAALFIRKNTVIQLLTCGISNESRLKNTLTISSLVCLCFFGMVFVSLLINNNNFIASHRYMLSVHPFVAILAGWGLLRVIKLQIPNNHSYAVLAIITPIFLLSLLFPFKLMMDYKLNLNNLFEGSELKARQLQNTYKLLADYRNTSSPTSVLLSFKNAEASYYANTSYIFHTDKRMVPVFQATNKNEAFQRLRKLGIDYVLVPNYVVTYIDQSLISSVLGDPGYAQLLTQYGSAKLYRLLRSHQVYAEHPVIIPQLKLTQPSYTEFSPHWVYSPLDSQSDIKVLPEKGFFIENNTSSPKSSFLYTMKKNTNKIHIDTGSIHLKPYTTYRLTTHLKGKGKLSAYIAQYREKQFLNNQKIWQTAIYNNDIAARNFQFKTGLYPDKYNLIFSIDGKGWINLSKIHLNEILYNTKNQHTANAIKISLANRGWEVIQKTPLYNKYNQLKKYLHLSHRKIELFEDWQASRENNNEILTLTPTEENTYLIKSPAKKLDLNHKNIKFNLAVKGKGTTTVHAYIIFSNGSKQSIYNNTLHLSDGYQPLKINIHKNQWAKELSHTSGITGYQFLISYKKPSDQSSGEINLKMES